MAEKGKPAQIPGPMIRIPARHGDPCHCPKPDHDDVSIHGMHTRPGKTDDTFEVPGGSTRDVTFSSGAPGAYYYWATGGGDTIGGSPYKEDSQLHGAFIVDAASTVVPDRIFVIGTWRARHFPQESFDIPTN